MMADYMLFINSLTPNFYLALSGTSVLISGLMMTFEWWYVRKYGASFIEQVSLQQLAQWLGAGAVDEAPAAAPPPAPPAADCKVWRNPLSLLHGAEYARVPGALTAYDMELTAQEQRAAFSSGAWGADSACGADAAEAHMERAWAEREPAARRAAAHAALAAHAECAGALLLLAEEEAPTVAEAERLLKRAWRCAEAAWRASAAAASSGGAAAAARARRDAALLAHVKRRAAMCARRLGRPRDAARLFRELARDAPPALQALAPHENLLEALLAARAWADAHALVARLEEAGARSAAVRYSAALLRARAGGAAGALAALRRALAANAHVPAYLLELRPLSLPPEHVLRGGDSEALAYAFFHLQHWQNAEGALELLAIACQASERWTCAGGACSACGDRELLAGAAGAVEGVAGAGPEAHGSAGRARVAAAAALCAAAALVALAAARWPFDWLYHT